MKIIYLLIILLLSAIACASKVYIMESRSISTIEFCVFLFLASVDLLLFSFAAVGLAREL
jgi:hypothetical protein